MSKQNNVNQEIELKGVKNILLIASGKGGVGKSTVAANLAVALSREGYKTGLMDADLYGPSIPIMFGIENERPEARKEGEKDIMLPVEKYGVKIMSVGFLMDAQSAVIWRGPMASNALTQLLTDTEWNDLDYLVIDMPPGTGDISITLAQKVKRAQSMIVITPQRLAVSDGLKASNMFLHEKLNIGVLGIIENMSYFIPAKHPDEKYYVFGNGGGHQLASQLQKPLLGEIPLVQDVSENADQGKNLFETGNELMVEAFNSLTGKVAELTKEKQQTEQ